VRQITTTEEAAMGTTTIQLASEACGLCDGGGRFGEAAARIFGTATCPSCEGLGAWRLDAHEARGEVLRLLHQGPAAVGGERVFWSAYEAADGFGQLSLSELREINGGFDWSHFRDSSQDGILRIAAVLRDAGVLS
jgi:hypothetical protein